MRKALLLVIGVLLIMMVSPASAQIDEFLGSWVNSDPDTQGMTRLEISQSGDEFLVHGWGSCTPDDCDWGEVVGYAYSPDISTSVSEGAQVVSAVFDFGFSQTIMIIHPFDEDNLEVETLTRFTDESGRSAYVAHYIFERRSALATPTQLSPVDGVVFNHFPRTTTLAWSVVDGAASYTVEIDCFHCCESGAWCTDVGEEWSIQDGLTANSHTFDYVGAQPGRWRVWSVDSAGQESEMSDWWEFEYTR